MNLQDHTSESDGSNVISLVLHWEGIGDIVIATAILNGLAEAHPDKEIRFYVTGSDAEASERWLAWAKLGWTNSYRVDQTPVVGRAYELGNPADPNNDPELLGIKGLRHHLWAGLCDTQPRRYRYDLPRKVREQADGILASMGIDPERPIVYFSPVTKAENRNWPLSRWYQLEQQLLRQTSAQIMIGTLAFMPWATRRQFDRFTTRHFLGEHPPDLLLALLERMSCIISNDSGFAHLGGILRVPTIAVCGGLYDGNAVFDWYECVQVVQEPSLDINQVAVENVLAAVQPILYDLKQPRNTSNR